MATFNVDKARKDGLDDATIQRMIQLTGAKPSKSLGGAKKGRNATALERLVLSFGDARGREQYIQQKGIGTNAKGDIMQPEGFDLGDITSKAGGLLPILGSIGGAVTALPAAAAVGVGTGGLGLPASLAIEGAASAGGAVAGEGARQGIGEMIGVRQNESQAESAKDLAFEGTVGTIAPGVGRATTAVGRPIVRSVGNSAVKAFTKALNPSPTLQRSGRFPAAEFIKRGYRGTVDGMIEQTKQVIAREKPIVDNFIKENSERVIGKVSEVIPKLGKIIDRKLKAAADSGPVKQFAKRFFQQVSKMTQGVDELTLGQADELRHAMDAELRRAYQAVATGAELPAEVEARQAVVKGLREMIRNYLPKEVAEARSAVHHAVLLQDALAQRVTKRGLLDLLGGGLLTGIGTLAGFGVAGGAGAVAGGALTQAGIRAAQSTPARTGAAALLRPTTRAVGRGVGAIPAPVRQRALDLGVRGMLRGFGE